MRRTSPAVEASAAVAVAAGWPLIAVAEQTGLSLSTVKRIKKDYAIVRGSKRTELVDAARASLREALTAEFTATESARLIRSQVAIANQIQALISEQLAALESNDEIDPLKAAKILATCATASKLSSDGLRRVLGLAAEPEITEALPELIVRDLTDEECSAIRADRDSWAGGKGDTPEPLDGIG